MTTTIRVAWRDRSGRAGWTAVSVLVAVLVVVPVAMLAVSILRPDVEVWRQEWTTRLPGEIADTVVLLVGVSVGAVALGGGLAWLTSAYEFPGVRWLSWMLVLPLAMPSYILGYLTLSIVGFTGPIQGRWRDWFGADAWFPPVESMWGAIAVFTLVLYPYVFLLARAALRDQAAGAYQAARTLGSSPREAARRVVLPMIRPAIAAGTAVVMMETLTDFATVQYFGVNTVSVSVFRVWRGSYNRDAAAEIATLVLVVALMIIALERIARGRARFGESGGAGAGLDRIRLRGWARWCAAAVCAAVVFAAFIGPVLQLLAWTIDEQTGQRGTPLLDNFWSYLTNSLQLAAFTVVACTIVAVTISNARRFGRRRTVAVANQLSAVGYAVPGPVIAIGVVIAVVALDDVLESIGLNLPGAVGTGSLIALVYAYSVRFLAPGLNAVDAGIGQVPDEITESARSLGSSPLRIVWRLHLPLAKASLATAVLLVAVDALKELPIVLLLRPFGFDTLPVWVYNLASESRYEQAALPSLAIIVIAMVPIVALSRRLDKVVT